MMVTGIIPARYGSSRFPGKPLVHISGKPMIQHVYERSLRAKGLDRLIVATDDTRIADSVRAFGGEFVITRTDHPSGTDRLAEASRILGLSDQDIVINIQGDEPLVEPSMIQLLITALEQSPHCSMATLAYRSMSEREYLDPNVVKVVLDGNGRALYFSRAPIPCRRDTGDSPMSFLKHLGFYAYRNDFLQAFTHLPPGGLESIEKLEQLRALENGHAIQVALSRVESFGVDTPEDLDRISEHFIAR
jgi:3-deoxy-manno-octulosonate cytidylyltransferase (CMP-KDO synthetase)